MPGIKPQLNDVVRTRIVCATADQVAENVLHYRVLNTPTTGGATLAEIAAALDTLVESDYKAALSNQATYRGVGAQNITGQLSAEFSTSANAGVGGISSGLLPTQTSAVLRKFTAYGGSAGRGRIYLPFGPVNAMTTTGGMTAGYLILAEAVAAVIPTLLVVTGATGSTTLTLCLFAKASPATVTIVEFIHAVGLWGTQRRRGQYGRKNVIPF